MILVGAAASCRLLKRPEPDVPKGAGVISQSLIIAPMQDGNNAAVNAAPLRLGQAVAAPLCSGPATTADRGTVAQ